MGEIKQSQYVHPSESACCELRLSGVTHAVERAQNKNKIRRKYTYKFCTHEQTLEE